MSTVNAFGVGTTSFQTFLNVSINISFKYILLSMTPVEINLIIVKRYTGLRALLSAMEFQLRLCVPEELLLTAATISSAVKKG